MVPGGHALARSMGGGFEPEEKEERVLALDLVELREEEPEQFVELDQANDRRPTRSKRVADRNSDVEHETKAPPGRPAAPSVAGSQAARVAEPTDETSEEELVDANDGRMPGAEPTAAEIARDWGKLGGSTGMLHDSFGTAGRPDNLPDVEQGRESVLDSKEHLYASFFSRMRGRILEHWDAQDAIDRHDPQAKQISGKPRTTVVRMYLDRDGKIEKLVFAVESQVDYLDEEAIRALKAAGPFPNPPEGLFDDEDEFMIQVAFTVEPDGGTRIFRY
jgi:TonB family protein